MRTRKQGSLSQNLELDTHDRASGQELPAEKDWSRSQIFLYVYTYVYVYVYTYVYMHTQIDNCVFRRLLFRIILFFPSCSYKQNGDEQTVRGNNIFPANKVVCIYMYIYTHIFIHTYIYTEGSEVR